MGFKLRNVQVKSPATLSAPKANALLKNIHSIDSDRLSVVVHTFGKMIGGRPFTAEVGNRWPASRCLRRE